jgi:hypothetical protein
VSYATDTVVRIDAKRLIGNACQQAPRYLERELHHFEGLAVMAMRITRVGTRRWLAPISSELAS